MKSRIWNFHIIHKSNKYITDKNNISERIFYLNLQINSYVFETFKVGMKIVAEKSKYDCIIIGGGGTGTGIARDLSLRGLSVVLLEKNDLAEGTTGRCHAMVHSGARYVYKDKEAATECAQESQILFKIAPHISDACGGYFMGVSEEDVAYGDEFAQACHEANVNVEEVTPTEFLNAELNCNPATQRVFHVQDGYIDPFLLTFYNAYDAKRNDASITDLL